MLNKLIFLYLIYLHFTNAMFFINTTGSVIGFVKYFFKKKDKDYERT